MGPSSTIAHLSEQLSVRRYGYVKSARATWQQRRLVANKVVATLSDGSIANAVVLGERPLKNDVLARLVGSNYTKTPLRDLSIFRALRARPSDYSADFVACQTTPATAPIFRLLGWKILPIWLDCTLSLKADTETVLSQISRTIRYDIRKANALGMRVSDEPIPNEAAIFHEQMHEPMIKSRHRDLALMTSAGQTSELLQQGRLLKVFANGRWVAGMLVTFRTRDLWCTKIGWLVDDPSFRQDYAVSLLYERGIQLAGSLGFSSINFGGAHGFVDDGLLRYKMKWRMKLSVRAFQRLGGDIFGSIYDLVAIRLNPSSAATEKILHESPFLTVEPRGFGVQAHSRSRPAYFDHLGKTIHW